MVTIYEEFPLAAVLSQQFQETHCAKCFQPLDNLKSDAVTCDDCVDVSYCSIKCQRADWKIVHMYECEILRSQKAPLTPTMRLCLRVLIQKHGGKTTEVKTSNGRTLDDLETNYTEFRNSPTHNQFLTDIMTILNTSGCGIFPENLEPNQTIALICSILCNSFSIIDELRVEPIGTGLYVGMSKYNHSCASKCHVVFNKSEAMIRKGPETRTRTISYVSRMLPTVLRQKSIRNVHFITCSCEMCKDEQLDAIALSTRCSDKECKGFVAGAKCKICGKTAKFGYEVALQHTEKLIDILENFFKEEHQNTYQDLLKLRAEFSEVLAEPNVAILQLDEQIAYTAATLEVMPADMEEIAVRGCDHYIKRLGVGAPEVTRRLYIMAGGLLKVKESGIEISEESMELMITATESCSMSHGREHPMSDFMWTARIYA